MTDWLCASRPQVTEYLLLYWTLVETGQSRTWLPVYLHVVVTATKPSVFIITTVITVTVLYSTALNKPRSVLTGAYPVSQKQQDTLLLPITSPFFTDLSPIFKIIPSPADSVSKRTTKRSDH